MNELQPDQSISNQLFCNHLPNHFATNNNGFKNTLMESILINRDHHPLNKDNHSLPLELFEK